MVADRAYRLGCIPVPYF